MSTSEVTPTPTAAPSRLRAAISIGFPLVVLVALPLCAWAILPIPALIAQWTVPPRYRSAVTVAYVVAVVSSAVLFAGFLAPSETSVVLVPVH